MSQRVRVNGEVRAAGGLVLRSGTNGPEVLIVHRPHRSDWSFPKGHLEVGETAEQGALREVEEETGLVCALIARLAPVRYIDHRGQPKVVDYWTMEVLSGALRPNDEVDEIEWMSLEAAPARLSYQVDHELVRKVSTVPNP